MRIAILTFSKEDNFGANLQCYALSKVLREWGHDVNIIDIQLKHPKPSIMSLLTNRPQTFLFNFFRTKYFPKFTRKYLNEDDIKSDPPCADLFIVGSDQVWNPNITKQLNPKLYFFSFLSETTKRISYAASFGSNKWEFQEVEEYKHLLEKFNAISVRELSGIKICEETFNVKAQEVLDPTLLLSSYDDICGNYQERKQTNEIIYFSFSHKPKYEKDIVRFAKENNLEPIHIRGGLRGHNGMKSIPFLSVKKWLNKVRYARFVVTGSFHCTAFSIIFKKQFISLPSGSIERSERKINLLNNLGIGERYFDGESSLYEFMKVKFREKIDFSKVEPNLSEYKKDSFDFLRRVL